MKITDFSGKFRPHLPQKSNGFRLKVTTLALLIVGMLSHTAQAQGLTVNYNGESDLIQTDPLYTTGTHYAIYPGTPLQPGTTGNIVNINADVPSSAQVETIYGGLTAGDDNLTGNTVNVNAANTETAYIVGAESTGNGNVTNNRIVISDSHISQAAGGYAFTRNTIGTSSYNSLVMQDSTARGAIHGAVSRADDVIGNTVMVTGSSISNVDGAFTQIGEAASNTVRINDSSVLGNIAGSNVDPTIDTSGNAFVSGLVANKNTHDNRVTLTDSTVTATSAASYVAGGRINGTGYANNNTVNLENSTLNTSVYGGFSAGGTAVNNTVTLSGSTLLLNFLTTNVPNYLIGGRTNSLYDAAENHVIIRDKSIVNINVYGGYSYDGNASQNQVIVDNSTVNSVVRGGYTLNYDPDNLTDYANSNIVSIQNGSTITGEISGGHVYNDGQATSNIVNVSGSTVTQTIYGGYVKSDGRATGNIVNSGNGANIQNTVYGGYVGGNGNAIGNVVSLDGATVSGNIYGGYIGGNGSAANNTITLSNNTSVTGSTIYGGYVSGNVIGETSGNNTLNLQNWSGSANNIAGIDTISIDTPVVKNGSVILGLTDTNVTQPGNAQTGTTVIVNSIAGGSTLGEGDRIHLIRNMTGGVQGFNTHNGQVRQGISVVYNIQYEQDANNVDALIGKGSSQPENVVLNEGRVASLAFLNGGADLLADQIIHGKNVFGYMDGGHSRYDTGSSVKVDGVRLIAGVANTWKQANGDMSGGAFIEAGWGNTGTHNTIAGNELAGSGDVHYYGAGLLGRYDWTHGAMKGLYAEASIHAGKLGNEYHNNGLADSNGKCASYDVDSLYYGIHTGIGYLLGLSGNYQLDTNIRYTWTHIESENATIDGDKFHFDALNSHRTRLGTRLKYTASPQYTPYAGIAWEYEWDGKAKGSVLGYAMNDASLQGSTGIVELGVTFQPTAKSNLTVNAGVSAYFGQRDGAVGQFRMNYAF